MSASAVSGATPRLPCVGATRAPSEIQSYYFTNFYSSVAKEKSVNELVGGIFDVLVKGDTDFSADPLTAPQKEFIEKFETQPERSQKYFIHLLSVLIESIPATGEDAAPQKLAFLKATLEKVQNKVKEVVKQFSEKLPDISKRDAEDLKKSRGAMAASGRPFALEGGAFVKAVKTPGDGNCGIHAMFGTVDGKGPARVEDADVKNTREALASFVTELDEQGYFHEAYYEEIQKCLTSADVTGNSELKKIVDKVDSADGLLAEDKKAELVKCYAKLIEAGKWLTALDMDLLALRSGCQVEVVFARDSGSFAVTTDFESRLNLHIKDVAAVKTVVSSAGVARVVEPVRVANFSGNHWVRIVGSTEKEANEADEAAAKAASAAASLQMATSTPLPPDEEAAPSVAVEEAAAATDSP